MATAAVGVGLGGQFVPSGLALTDIWTINHTPGAAAQATATKAAGGAGVRHVCKRIAFSAAGAAAAAVVAVNVNVRDGASGAGTILWSKAVSVLQGTTYSEDLGDYHIIGTAATAMTIEFSAAGAAGTIEAVNMQGYDAA